MKLTKTNSQTIKKLFPAFKTISEAEKYINDLFADNKDFILTPETENTTEFQAIVALIGCLPDLPRQNSFGDELVQVYPVWRQRQREWMLIVETESAGFAVDWKLATKKLVEKVNE